MEKGLTSYVLNYLLNTCFDSKADMARQLDMSKRALQRVMNEPQLSKGGSVALVKALCYCARHHVPVDPILHEYAAHDTNEQKDFIYDPSTVNLAAYLGVLPEVPGLQSAVYLWQALYPRSFPKRYKLQLWEI